MRRAQHASGPLLHACVGVHAWVACMHAGERVAFTRCRSHAHARTPCSTPAGVGFRLAIDRALFTTGDVAAASAEDAFAALSRVALTRVPLLNTDLAKVGARRRAAELAAPAMQV